MSEHAVYWIFGVVAVILSLSLIVSELLTIREKWVSRRRKGYPQMYNVQVPVTTRRQRGE